MSDVKPKPKSVKRLYSIAETAEYLGIAVQTLRNRLTRTTTNPFPIKPIRGSGKPVFDVRDLDEYIDNLKANA